MPAWRHEYPCTTQNHLPHGNPSPTTTALCNEPLLGTVTALRHPRCTANPSHHPSPATRGREGRDPHSGPNAPSHALRHHHGTRTQSRGREGTPNLGKTPPAPASPHRSLFRGTRQTATAATQTRRCAFPAAAPPPRAGVPRCPAGQSERRSRDAH